MSVPFRCAFLLLLACGLGGCAPRSAPPAAAAKNEVAIAITEDGFEPARPQVPKGVPLTVVFTRQTDQTCATGVTFGRLGRTVALPLHQPVRVELPAVEDTLSFSCPMDMYHGMLRASR